MILRLEPKAGGPPVPLDKAVLFFGRHPDCDVRLVGSPKVSRRHCCIAQVNDRWVVRDLGSMNGVTLNGTRVEREVDLKPGDELLVGDVAFAVAEAADKRK
ncbi:MAG TPA: FHA domain-containing protein [Planctomycetaceae bacterium]